MIGSGLQGTILYAHIRFLLIFLWLTSILSALQVVRWRRGWASLTCFLLNSEVSFKVHNDNCNVSVDRLEAGHYTCIRFDNL